MINPIGPVEIPCAPEDQDAPLCDRDAAIADNVKLYGPSGAANESGLLTLCGQTPEKLTANFDGRVASSTCDLRVPEDGTIVGVLGHMHTLGKTYPPHARRRHAGRSRSCSTSRSGASTGR